MKQEGDSNELIVTLQNELSELKRESTMKHDNQMIAIKQLQEDNEKLKLLLIEKDEKIEKLKSTLYGEGLLNEIEDEKTKCEKMRMQLEERNHEIQSLKEQTDDLLCKIMKLRNERREVEDHLNEVEMEKEWIEMQLQSQSYVVKLYIDRVKQLEREKTKNEITRRTMKIEHNALQNDLAHHNKILKAFHHQLSPQLPSSSSSSRKQMKC